MGQKSLALAGQGQNVAGLSVLPDNDSSDMREVTGTCDVTGTVGKVSTLCGTWEVISWLSSSAVHARLQELFTLVRNQGNQAKIPVIR